MNRAVSIAVEYDTVESLTASQGIPIEQGLVDLKAQGVNSLVLSEGTVGELLARGRQHYRPRAGPSGSVIVQFWSRCRLSSSAMSASYQGQSAV